MVNQTVGTRSLLLFVLRGIQALALRTEFTIRQWLVDNVKTFDELKSV